MEKLVLIYESPPSEPLQTDALLTKLAVSVVPQLHGLTVHVRNLELPREFLAAGGFDSRVAFALAAWVDSHEQLPALQEGLDAFGTPVAAYAVTESVEREYASIAWSDGVKSPGVTLFAHLRRRAGLGIDEFHRRWYEHSRLSLRLHPLTRYYRNYVRRRLWGEGPEWDAIVEERVGSIEDLLPARFYPDAASQALAIEDLDRLVDVAQDDMRCALLEEYLLKRPPWLEASK